MSVAVGPGGYKRFLAPCLLLVSVCQAACVAGWTMTLTVRTTGDPVGNVGAVSGAGLVPTRVVIIFTVAFIFLSTVWWTLVAPVVTLGGAPVVEVKV